MDVQLPSLSHTNKKSIGILHYEVIRSINAPSSDNTHLFLKKEYYDDYDEQTHKRVVF